MPAQLVRSLSQLPAAAKGGVVTIGNFDGVHLGHQMLIRETVSRAKARSVPAVLVTFEPHPLEFFAGGRQPVARLTRLREKFLALRETGLDYIVLLKFNQQLAEKSASDFITEILLNYLQPTAMIIGDDFHFGRGRQGNLELLNQFGEQHGFTATAMPTFELMGERVSSTRIRKVLQQADHELASQLLGRPYTMQGRVRHGDKIGRQWGFPTANIFLHRALAPVNGIYTVLVHGLTSKALPGAANLGVRPTVDGTRALLEVHLLDFDQQIYGRYVEVEFCKKLRDEVRYPTIELLKEQIARDVADSRDYFQQQGLL